MKEFPDHYAALGIRSDADQEVIAAAYRALVKKYHPDTAQGHDADAAERFLAVKAAHDVLGHAERRREYDAQRKARGFDRHEAAGSGTIPSGDDGLWSASAASLPGRRGYHSTRPAETVLRAERYHDDAREDGGALFRFAVVTVLACFLGAAALLVLWPSIADIFGDRSGAVEALTPPPQPGLQPGAATQQTVTGSEKSKADGGGDAMQAAIPQDGTEDMLPAAKTKPVQQKPAVPQPAAPKPVVQKPAPKAIPEETPSLYALSMREESDGVLTVLADGTLTFNSRRACEDFARQARDRRLDAAILQTGEPPEISWECKGR